MDALSRWAWKAADSLLPPPLAPSGPFPDALALNEFLCDSLDSFYLGGTPTGTHSTHRTTSRVSACREKKPAQAAGGSEAVAWAAAEAAGEEVAGATEAAAASGASLRPGPVCERAMTSAPSGVSSHMDAAVPVEDTVGDELRDSRGGGMDASGDSTEGALPREECCKAPSAVHVSSDSLASCAMAPETEATAGTAGKDASGVGSEEQGAGCLATEEGGSGREDSSSTAVQFQASSLGSPTEEEVTMTVGEQMRPEEEQTRPTEEPTAPGEEDTRSVEVETRPKGDEAKPGAEETRVKGDQTRPLYAYSSLKALPGASACVEDSCSDDSSDTSTVSDTASEQSWASEAFSSASLFEDSLAWVGSREAHSLSYSHSPSHPHSRSELSSPLWGPLLGHTGSHSETMAALSNHGRGAGLHSAAGTLSGSLGKWAGLPSSVKSAKDSSAEPLSGIVGKWAGLPSNGADACTSELSDCGSASEALHSGSQERTQKVLEKKRRVVKKEGRALEKERRVVITQTEGAEDTDETTDATELPQRSASLAPSSQLASSSQLARSFQPVPSSQLGWEVCLNSLALLAPEAPGSGAHPLAEGHVAAGQAGYGAEQAGCGAGQAGYEAGQAGYWAGGRRGLEAVRSRGRAGAQGPRAWPSLARIQEQQVLPPSREALLRTATGKWSVSGEGHSLLEASAGKASALGNPAALASRAALANPYVSRSASSAGAVLPALQEAGAAVSAFPPPPLSPGGAPAGRVQESTAGSESGKKSARAGGKAPRKSRSGSGSAAAKPAKLRKSPLATGSPLSTDSPSAGRSMGSNSVSASAKCSQQQQWPSTGSNSPQGLRSEAKAVRMDSIRPASNAMGSIGRASNAMGPSHRQMVGGLTPGAHGASAAFGQQLSGGRSMSMRASAQAAQPAWKY